MEGRHADGSRADASLLRAEVSTTAQLSAQLPVPTGLDGKSVARLHTLVVPGAIDWTSKERGGFAFGVISANLAADEAGP